MVTTTALRPASGALIQGAAGAAAWAASRAGVTVREVSEMDELMETSLVFQRIWGSREIGTPISRDLLRALSHADNYVAGAFDGSGQRGALVGFMGGHGDRLHLHSHILGVIPSNQVRGIGFALKLHQRSWALERGHAAVEWTFDPLVRRNAFFNLTKLGADIDSYHVNFYGVMDDEQNLSDDSDRIVVSWAIASQKAIDAAAGVPYDAEPDTVEAAAVRLLSTGGDGAPVVLSNRLSAPVLVLETPPDIVQIRREAPAMARRWREALRDTMLPAIASGYCCTGVTRSGSYVFRLPRAF